ILRKQAAAVGAQVLEGHELTGFEQDANGVTVIAQDIDSGSKKTLRGRYLIDAGGAHSKGREQLGIAFDGRGIFSHSMTVYFRADLAPLLLGKPLSVIYFNNPVFGGFMRMEKDCQQGFIGVNVIGDPKQDPVKAANAAVDISEPTLIHYVRTA